MNRALVIIGKAPRAGVTKTRLTPPLTPDEAAELYQAFLLDSVDLALGLGWERVSLVYPPGEGDAEALSALLPPAVVLLPQPGKGLGAALTAAFAEHFAAGFTRVVLIGSDNPSLPAAIIERASAALSGHDLVIGPSSDGGYYLIGMNQPHPEVFERIDWSTAVVYQQTMARARQAGLRVRSVDEWYDVDTVAELRRLRDDLARLPAATAPNTRRVIGSRRW